MHSKVTHQNWIERRRIVPKTLLSIGRSVQLPIDIGWCLQWSVSSWIPVPMHMPDISAQTKILAAAHQVDGRALPASDRYALLSGVIRLVLVRLSSPGKLVGYPSGATWRQTK